MTPLLEVTSVQKSFGGLFAVRDVSFSIAHHEIVGLMGANGAGKTTLFNLISGVARADAGSIVFNEHKIDRLRPDQIARRGIGRTFQIVKPFPGLTVLENVTVGLLYGNSADRGRQRSIYEDAETLLNELGLHRERTRLAGELTLAGRKRLEIARALATRPLLLMLDEVMAGLTPTEVSEALEMLAKLHQRYNLTMLIVEHNLRAMMRLCQRVVVLHHGVKIGEGTPQVVSQDQTIIDAYLGVST
jgi:branched-chain amino acid transport system ATP-binding protein